jgi:hypothetical protein
VSANCVVTKRYRHSNISVFDSGPASGGASHSYVREINDVEMNETGTSKWHKTLSVIFISKSPSFVCMVIR